ncbi:hypothetical protein CLV30_106141 [Haloactinopolyspora alba]|uniref:Uncharacterized protein n=1 Tax=Haloactinopolyspora alba TaxID=648780 RepID=A0A2P8E3V4_9ACTN|nr:hypothetical protein CLV30_106141 [Haloactinopolyspora alba]
MTHALMRGGPEHLGWGVERHVLASLFDALNLNTKISGNWKKGKEPKFPEWPRPETASATTKKKATVKDLWMKMSRR